MFHKTWRRTWASGPGQRAPSSPRPTAAAAAVFVQLTLRWGRNWAAQWHLARAVPSASGGTAQSTQLRPHLSITPAAQRQRR